MALLADLADLSDDLPAQTDFRAEGQRQKVDPFSRNVFCKISGLHIKAQAPHLVNALYGEETDLAMPLRRRMGVSDYPVILGYQRFMEWGFPLTLVFADINRYYASCHITGLPMKY